MTGWKATYKIWLCWLRSSAVLQRLGMGSSYARIVWSQVTFVKDNFAFLCFHFVLKLGKALNCSSCLTQFCFNVAICKKAFKANVCGGKTITLNKVGHSGGKVYCRHEVLEMDSAPSECPLSPSAPPLVIKNCGMLAAWQTWPDGSQGSLSWIR